MNAAVDHSVLESTALTHVAAAPTGRDLILKPDNLRAIERVAEWMAGSKQAVPKHLRGNLGGCVAVCMQAMRWNMDPFALASKTYTVDSEGPIAYEGQAIIAGLNNSALLATRLNFTWEGQWERIVGKFKQVESRTKKDSDGHPKKYIVPSWDFDKDEEGLKVIVTAYLVGEKEPRQLELFMKQARTRNSPLWTEDPKQQLAYLAARRWGRLHAPDVIMGVYSPDELMESQTLNMGEIEPVEPTVSAALLADAKAAAEKGAAAYEKFWKETGRTNREVLRSEHAILKKTAFDTDAKRTVDTSAKPVAAAPDAAPASTPAPASTGPITATYATVMDKMIVAHKKKDVDALDIAADWIKEIHDPAQLKELNAQYERMRGELTSA